ncbi:MAG TPA: MFS transporter [Candidatus Dormibacteraeota bacterium]|nr:MFS transporter [Candidatus Dormibacteraeota bacterium]
MKRLYTSLLCARFGGQMVVVALVLFVLARYRSPQLAGVAVALATFPGLVVSPLAGALLDRTRMSRLVTLDYGVGAATSLLVAVLAALDWLPSPLLLAIVFLSSLSAPLSFGGARSLVPVVVPRHLWERANALDSASYVVATIGGAPLAGVLVGLIGGGWTIGVSGLLTLAAMALMAGLDEPDRVRPPAGGSVVRNARAGLSYVVRNPTLRGLALTISVTNIGGGLVVVALPVLVLTRLHGGPAEVGFLWGISGAGALLSSLLAGRMKIQGRERGLIVLAIVVNLLAFALLPLAGSLLVVVISLVVLGLGEGPLNVGVFTLRQRRTDPAWFGRVFTVSMSLNSLGTPIGSALAGPLIGWSLSGTLWAVVAVTAVSMLFPLLVIPPDP